MRTPIPKRGKTVGRWIAWLAVVTLAEIVIFHHYDAELGIPQVPVVQSTQKQTVDGFVKIASLGPKELRPNLFALSPNQSEFAYVDSDNDFNVINTRTGKIIRRDALGYTADYVKWLDDNDLFVGTEQLESNSSKDIRFSTFDVSGNTFHLWKVFQGYSQTAKLEDVTFSPFTNDTYVLLGDAQNSDEWHFDTNNQVWQYHFEGKIVENWLVSKTSDQLYYQDTEEGVPDIWVYDYRTSSSHLVAQEAKLLAMRNDTLVYANLNQSGKVTGLSQVSDWEKGSKRVLTLHTPISLSNLFADGNNYCQIGNTTLTNLKTHKAMSTPSSKQHIVSDGNLYLIGASGSIFYYPMPNQDKSKSGA